MPPPFVRPRAVLLREQELPWNRPGRDRTCNPRFGSPLLVTPALQSLLVFRDSALSHQRRRCWTTPALTLLLALRRSRPALLLSAEHLLLLPLLCIPPETIPESDRH